ncbi:MAG TPA: hypothetical protein VK067_00240 [Pseudogracilibacillus sp.]|nr:hypothetical protein [Pseudogracilibacillus sp.]
MYDSHMNDRDKKGDEDMVKVSVLKTPDTRKAKIYNAIEEVEKIKSGELPR